jgi:hypothetical protein
LALGGDASGFESRKSAILVDLDKLTQRELLQGSRDQQIEKIVDTMELITPDCLRTQQIQTG